MKKLIAATLTLACALGCACGITACGKDKIPTFYGKTITLTGKALPIDWTSKEVYDNGPDGQGINGPQYTYGDLLTKYWSQIDFEHEVIMDGLPVKPWTGSSFADATALTNYVDAHLDTVFEPYKDCKFTFGSQEERTCTLTAGSNTLNAKVIETREQFDAEKASMDDMVKNTWVDDKPGDGTVCMLIADANGDGTYDSCGSFILTRYVINKQALTAEFEMQILKNTDENGNNSYSTFGTMTFVNTIFCIWGKPDASGSSLSVVTLPMHPEVTVTDN